MDASELLPGIDMKRLTSCFSRNLGAVLIQPALVLHRGGPSICQEGPMIA